MLRALGVTALVAVAGVSPGPGTLRPARPADAAPRNGKTVLTQEWRIVATDARSRSSVLLVIDGIGTSSAAQLFYWPTVPQTGVSQVFHELGALTGTAGVAVRGIDLHHTAAGWVLQLDQGVVKLRLTFTGARPGPLAAPWPVGQVSGPGVVPFASSLNWAVPVASATVNGTIEHDGGASIPLSGWRGYVDHTWGRYDFGLGLMQHWDWAVVQSAQDTWIVDGFETGPGLSQWKHHDAQWRGVLVHAGANGVSSCRARATRAGWREYYAGGGYVYPQALTASCGGARVTFTRTKDAVDVETGAALSSARTSTGGYGLFDELVLLAR